MSSQNFRSYNFLVLEVFILQFSIWKISVLIFCFTENQWGSHGRYGSCHTKILLPAMYPPAENIWIRKIFDLGLRTNRLS